MTFNFERRIDEAYELLKQNDEHSLDYFIHLMEINKVIGNIMVRRRRLSQDKYNQYMAEYEDVIHQIIVHGTYKRRR